jgi:hypothetical protein
MQSYCVAVSLGSGITVYVRILKPCAVYQLFYQILHIIPPALKNYGYSEPVTTIGSLKTVKIMFMPEFWNHPI